MRLQSALAGRTTIRFASSPLFSSKKTLSVNGVVSTKACCGSNMHVTVWDIERKKFRRLVSSADEWTSAGDSVRLPGSCQIGQELHISNCGQLNAGFYSHENICGDIDYEVKYNWDLICKCWVQDMTHSFL